MDANVEAPTKPPSILSWIRRGVVCVLIALAAMAGITTLLGFLGRWWWPLDLLSHFRVQYFLVLAVALPLLWIAGRWRWAALAGVLAAVNALLIAPYFWLPESAGEKDARPLRLSLLRIPIDHCLVGDGVRVGRFGVGSPVGSDHLPIVVDVCRKTDGE